MATTNTSHQQLDEDDIALRKHMAHIASELHTLDRASIKPAMSIAIKKQRHYTQLKGGFNEIAAKKTFQYGETIRELQQLKAKIAEIINHCLPEELKDNGQA